MSGGWIINVTGNTPCCNRELALAREPGTTLDVEITEFGCPYCGSLLRIVGAPGFERYEAAAPCEICDLNGIPTEGPLCSYCGRCELDCDGEEYPEGWPEAHTFELAQTNQ